MFTSSFSPGHPWPWDGGGLAEVVWTKQLPEPEFSWKLTATRPSCCDSDQSPFYQESLLLPGQGCSGCDDWGLRVGRSSLTVVRNCTLVGKLVCFHSLGSSVVTPAAGAVLVGVLGLHADSKDRLIRVSVIGADTGV